MLCLRQKQTGKKGRILDVVSDEFIVPCRQWKNTTVFL